MTKKQTYYVAFPTEFWSWNKIKWSEETFLKTINANILLYLTRTRASRTTHITNELSKLVLGVTDGRKKTTKYVYSTEKLNLDH